MGELIGQFNGMDVYTNSNLEVPKVEQVKRTFVNRLLPWNWFRPFKSVTVMAPEEVVYIDKKNRTMIGHPKIIEKIFEYNNIPTDVIGEAV